MPHRIARIRAGRHPHEVLVCLCAVIIGASGLLFEEGVSPSIHTLFGPPWRTVYFVALLAGGLITLAGIVKHKVTGMLIERAGLAFLASTFLAFSGVVLLVNGTSGIASALVPLCFTVTTVWRGLQIGRDLQLLKEYLADYPMPPIDRQDPP